MMLQSISTSSDTDVNFEAIIPVPQIEQRHSRPDGQGLELQLSADDT
jgi:hypothetical protein